jgi:putative FmdB family regulatory protein
MPVYEYVCSACGHRADILHGVNDAGPQFCPSCGAESTMRKAFAAPAIVFKGSGWAKKDRRSTPSPSASKSGSASSDDGSKPSSSSDGGRDGSKRSDGTGDGTTAKPSESTSAAKPAD